MASFPARIDWAGRTDRRNNSGRSGNSFRLSKKAPSIMTNDQSQLHIENPTEWLREAGFLEPINRYLDLLQDENKRINLVSRETSREDLIRLATESLIPLASSALKGTGVGRYLDIGSGGGFPAIPIVLVHQPKASILLERRQKKAAALNRFLTGLNIGGAESLPVTFEEFVSEQKFDLVTVRLVRLEKRMLSRVAKCLASGGSFLCYGEPSDQVSIPSLSVTTHYYSIEKQANLRAYSIYNLTQ